MKTRLGGSVLDHRHASGLRPVRLVLLCSTAFAGSWFSVHAAAERPPLTYNRDVRPILADKCFTCHGPDKNARKADLRLDREADATADLGEGRRAISPGQPEASEVILRINSADESERMPPARSPKQLTNAEKATLAEWIRQGGRYEAHWAFIPPVRPRPPVVSDATHPIDAFIEDRLAREAVEPLPAADPITLARRLSFDLTGLPVDPEDAAGLAHNISPQAYAALVDKLLASPRYGERMAVYWLDQVRYADTTGYHSDSDRPIWPYRDYVINAFNTNKPFDQFTIEQIAGDLLPGPTREQLVATGFNRLNQTTGEGGAQAKEYRAKYNADRVRAVGSAWLGATLGCAECHDHKFDPYTTKDFYSMAAFFADLEEDDVYSGGELEPLLRLTSERQDAHIAALDGLIKGLETMLSMQTDELAAAEAAWIAELRTKGLSAPGWLVQRPVAYTSAGGADLVPLDDDSILSTGEVPLQETYTFTLKSGLEKITGLRIEAMSHPDFRGGIARVRGNFILNEVEIEAKTPDGGAKRVPIGEASEDCKGIGPGIAAALDGDLGSAWSKTPPGPDMRKTITAIFPFKEPLHSASGAEITVRMIFLGGAMSDRTSFGRLRFALTGDEKPVLDAPSAGPEWALSSACAPSELAAYYRTFAPALDSYRAQLAEAREKRRGILASAQPTMVAKQRFRPRLTRILPRGNWQDDSGAVVEPGTPTGLPELGVEGRRPTRLDLARWIVSPRNPLTARVQMNRLWKLFFGHGLSRTLEDSGLQGEWPTHPELLDWLAVEFMESGWDLKHMARLIVTSRAYQRSSAAPPELREADPENRLFARQSPVRIEAEFVRDAMLAASGLLVERVGGPSVKPYQPDGYWENLNYPKRTYAADSAPAQYRRGLYTHWQRSFLHPALKAFDAPSREECVARRVISNTPLQALAMLNDPSSAEAARVLGARIVKEGGATDAERVRWAFRRVLARDPNREEQATLAALATEHLVHFSADPGAAKAVLSVGLAPQADGIDPVQAAAWSSVARVLLNLHETITRS